MKNINNKGSQLAYQEAADPQNPAIILLHANSSTGLFFEHQLTSYLINDYHLIAPDFLGHSESGFNNDSYFPHPLGLAKSVVALIKVLKIPEVMIYGVSFGGHVAMERISLLNNRQKGIMISGAPPIKIPLNLQEAFIATEASALTYSERFNGTRYSDLA
jgi:pimeloyl-ACP methyl ester carboxylesterase